MTIKNYEIICNKLYGWETYTYIKHVHTYIMSIHCIKINSHIKVQNTALKQLSLFPHLSKSSTVSLYYANPKNRTDLPTSRISVKIFTKC